MGYAADWGSIALDILSRTRETPWNKEFLEEWRNVALIYNVEHLYEGEYELEEFDEEA